MFCIVFEGGERFLKRVALVCVLAVSLLVLFPPVKSFAEDFSVSSIGDIGNVTIMEASGNYDADLPDGSSNTIPRQLITQKYYETHKDEYDFLVIFTNFDFKMPEIEARAFYKHIKNDTIGLGLELFDYSQSFGSDGLLQGTIDMGNLNNIVTNSYDPKFDTTLVTLCHEVLHRWSAKTSYIDENGDISNALLGRGGSHWSFLLDSDASLEYGNRWRDNGDGTYTSTDVLAGFSPLDLYLMGMIGADQVPPMMLIDSPLVDPERLPERDVTISGTTKTVTIEDIIAANGERVPSVENAQKSFKAGFIYVVEPGTFAIDDLTAIEKVRNGFLTRFSILTDGKGLVDVAAVRREDVPVNPGIEIATRTPRSLPPSIDDGAAWLAGNQKTDGLWSDGLQTVMRDTAAAVHSLDKFPGYENYVNSGRVWLKGVNASNNDYFARKASVLTADPDSLPLLDEIAAQQNPDGGWGAASGFASSALDTALVLRALLDGSYADADLMQRATDYLLQEQNQDGGWSDGGLRSMVQATVAAISALDSYRSQNEVVAAMDRGGQLLLLRQNPDGGFGNSPSTVYDTAAAVSSLQLLGQSFENKKKGVAWLQAMQDYNGSWFGSPYQTAVAIDALWAATNQPDLSVLTENVKLLPGTIKTVPTQSVLSVSIENLGRKDIEQAKVVCYDGAVTAENIIAEQVLAFPGQITVDATFSIEINDSNPHLYTIVVDPDNEIDEQSENNNRATIVIEPELTYDFVVQPDGLTLSSPAVNAFETVTFSATIANQGTVDAYDVPVDFLADIGGSTQTLVRVSVDLPANETVVVNQEWLANLTGADLMIRAVVDSSNRFIELDEANNSAETTLTIFAGTKPNLSVSHDDFVFLPTPALQGTPAAISVSVHNNGFADATAFSVALYEGDPNAAGLLIGEVQSAGLAVGQSMTFDFVWGDTSRAGERLITVIVDPNSLVDESSETDNLAFVTHKVLSLSDLAISSGSISVTPTMPKVGDLVQIAVVVINAGEQEAIDIPVVLSVNNIEIDSRAISLPGNSQKSVTFPYLADGKEGNHEVTVTVDPDNLLTEQNENNNSANTRFVVQDADLWLTEKVISPDNDGIQDSTTLGFRLQAADSITVQIVDSADKLIQSNEFTDIESGSLVWDGRDAVGAIVSDGDFRLQLVSSLGDDLGSLTVTVDTNRSLLDDALMNEGVSMLNMSCQGPDFKPQDVQWFADDSGFVLEHRAASQDDPYSTGLYVATTLNNEYQQLTPAGWMESTAEKIYYLNNWEVSPVDNSVLVVRLVDIFDVSTNSFRDYSAEIWNIDAFSGEMQLLEEHLLLSAYTDTNIAWAPDGSKFAFMLSALNRDDDYYPTKYLVYYLDGRAPRIVFEHEAIYDDLDMTWSQDSSKLAFRYMFSTNADYWNWNDVLRVADDATQTSKEMFSSNTSEYLRYLWAGDHLLVTSGNSSGGLYHLTELWRLDQTGGKELLSSKMSNYRFEVSPDGLSALFTEQNELKADHDNIVFVDQRRQRKILHTTRNNFDHCTLYDHPLTDISWAPDSSKLSFVDLSCENLFDCYYFTHLFTYDIAQDDFSSIKISDARYICGAISGCYSDAVVRPSGPSPEGDLSFVGGLHYLGDNTTVIGQDTNGAFALNISSGSKNYFFANNR